MYLTSTAAPTKSVVQLPTVAVAFATVLVEFSAICILLNGTLRALEAI